MIQLAINKERLEILQSALEKYRTDNLGRLIPDEDLTPTFLNLIKDVDILLRGIKK